MKAIKSIVILAVFTLGLIWIINNHPVPVAPPINQVFTEPGTCHREADGVPVGQLVDTIKRMQQECGVPPLTPRVTETPEESRRACEDLKAEGFVTNVDECMANVGGWHQR